jgi:hypothetical protein
MFFYVSRLTGLTHYITWSDFLGKAYESESTAYFQILLFTFKILLTQSAAVLLPDFYQ